MSRWLKVAICRERVFWQFLLPFLLLLVGCRSFIDSSYSGPSWKGSAGKEFGSVKPSHQRNWRADLEILPFAKVKTDKVTIYNIRDCHYTSENDYRVKHFDRTYKLEDLKTVDFLVVPFRDAPALAHTMLSFGFEDGEQLVLSVEARLEKDEVYTPLGGAMKQYELMYVVGTERDLIRLRTDIRNVSVFIYRAKASPMDVQGLFLDMLQRMNQIAMKPEFYDTLTNNCTTNLVAHVNKLRPGTIPADYRILFPGYSDQFVNQLGLIDTDESADAMRNRSAVLPTYGIWLDSKEYSRQIRNRY